MSNAKALTKKILGRLIRATIRRLPPLPANQFKTLKQLKWQFSRVQVPTEIRTVKGQLWPEELQALYALGAMAESPMLEIGSWLGLSATCLAKGIVASGVSKNFTACDLNPGPANYRELPDGRTGFFYPPESTTPMGACSRKIYEDEIRPVVAHPDGVVGQLRANLRRMGVEPLVQIVTGDFKSVLPAQKYRFIFCDTLHDPTEIRANASALLKLVTDGTILACHDTTPENRAELLRHFQFSETIQIATLFVGVIKLRGDGIK
jgi:predicted O-methyltransferase YrrM